MKRLVTFAVAALGAVFPALAESRTLELPAFHAVDVSSGLTAEITAGPAQAITIESNSTADLDDLRVDVRDGTLYFWYEWNFGNLLWALDRNVTVTVSAPEIDRVEASVGASIEATKLDCADAEFDVSSGASLNLTARATIDGDVSSGGSAVIYGKPEVRQLDTSSGGSISFRD